MGGDSERRTRNEIRRELIDSVDEELEMELDDARAAEFAELIEHKAARDTIDRNLYFSELFRLQGELVKLQDWVRAPEAEGGRDLRGPRRRRQGRRDQAHHAAPQPARLPRRRRCPRRTSASARNGTSSATSPHLPAAGEIVLFDRTWYNRAGVERVMGFCTRRASSRSSSARCPSSSACWCAPASCCSNTGSRSPTRSSISAS